MDKMLEVINKYFTNLVIDRYIMDEEEAKVLKDYEHRYFRIYYYFLSLDYKTKDINEKIDYIIIDINKLYQELKEWFSTYFKLDISILDVKTDVDISTYYDLLYVKKDNYNSSLLDNIINKYVNYAGYNYLKDNIIATKQLFVENYRIIDESVLVKFNATIINIFDYYNRALKSDLNDIKRLKRKKLIGNMQESHLRTVAGLWNYDHCKERALSHHKPI